jgi:hypothetical protein
MERSNTLVKTLRQELGDSFAAGYRADTKLGTVLKRKGVDTLDQLRKKVDAPYISEKPAAAAGHSPDERSVKELVEAADKQPSASYPAMPQAAPCRADGWRWTSW